MGRYYFDKKAEADDLKKIAIWKLNEWGYLKGFYVSGTITWTHSWSGEESSVRIQILSDTAIKRLRIYYTQTGGRTGETGDFDYEIPLTTTPCNFGGYRYWFSCPWYVNGKFCGRRVGVLYKGAKHFACRHCHSLTYASRNENRRHRLFALGKMLDLDSKKQELEEKIVTKYYRGKPTRKYKRLLKLQLQTFGYSRGIVLDELAQELIK